MMYYGKRMNLKGCKMTGDLSNKNLTVTKLLIILTNELQFDILIF
jgi:hypothetical protein